MSVIRIQNLSKQYRLGIVGTGTIAHDLNRWWHLIRDKQDPYLKIGEENIRDEYSSSSYIWALKDINLEVAAGERLGIIGKNGSGKSTLLKILSRVTGPSTGTIKYQGRIGSLLEVGTGFHQELTGRENIFLNGAILGMTKVEIRTKFDDIVDFSGCAKYIDTPVKRYSSGMLVRLGFAVAAFLEPEIMVVDEVLAVGDAEFQKKAIGKMKDVSQNSGRTILFVSHNMAAVKSLCNKCIILERGRIDFNGSVEEGVQRYLSADSGTMNKKTWSFDEQFDKRFILLNASIKVPQKSFSDLFFISEPLEFIISFRKTISGKEIDITLHFKDDTGYPLFSTSSATSKLSSNNIGVTGLIHYTFTIPPNFFNFGTIFIDLLVVESRKKLIYKENDVLAVTLLDKPKELGTYMGREPGAFLPDFRWENKTNENPK